MIDMGIKGQAVSVLFNAISHSSLDEIRENGRDFTRKGKIGPVNTVLQILTSERQSMESEILDLSARTGMPKVSDVAMFRARQRVSLRFLSSLLKSTIQSFEKRNRLMMSGFGGYRLIAIDGSKLRLPRTIDHREWLYHGKNKDSTVYMLEVQEAYDIENGLVLDFQINSRGNEKAMALCNVRAIRNMDRSPKIYVFDRGYASSRLISEIMEGGEFFVIRLPSGFYKDGQDLLGEKTGDIEYDRVFDRANTNEYRNDIGFRMKLLGKPMHLRMVRFEVGDGTVETLVTNLMSERMSLEQLKEIYRLRWTVETDYRHCKQRHLIDAFTGRRLRSVLQDIYSAELMHVLTLMTIWEASYDMKWKKYKHRMKINYASAARTLRKSHILDGLAKEATGFDKILAQLMDGMAKRLIPIRPDRKSGGRATLGTAKSDTYKR